MAKIDGIMKNTTGLAEKPRLWSIAILIISYDNVQCIFLFCLFFNMIEDVNMYSKATSSSVMI